MPIYYSLLQMYYDLFSHLPVVEHRLLFFYLLLLFVQVENVFVPISLCSLQVVSLGDSLGMTKPSQWNDSLLNLNRALSPHSSAY